MKWTIREIKQLDNGRQKRPYADHIYKWEICVEGKTEEADILPFCQEYLQHAQNEHDEYFKKYRDSNLSFEEHMRVVCGGYYTLTKKDFNVWEYEVRREYID